MNHGSLFSGIGGFDLAAEWMGWKNMFHCEWNEFGQKVLKHYWPNAASYGDITTTDFTIWRGKIDILTGGFPCQPYSTAGKRKGKEDARHLWPEMLRAIREIQPRYVVGENVRGLTNWNGGMVFDEVQADLEAEGYEVLPFLLPACAVNAPHRRDRIWFVAYSAKFGNTSRRTGAEIKRNRGGNDGKQEKRSEQAERFNGLPRLFRNAASTDSNGQYRSHSEHEEHTGEGREHALNDFEPPVITNANSGRQSGKEHRKEKSGRIAKKSVHGDWQNFPTESPIRLRDDGVSSKLDGITFSKWRNESIKAAGNAIVPQVAYQIFKAINL